MKQIIKQDKVYIPPLWQRFTSYLLSLVLLAQIMLPTTVQAYVLISNGQLESEANNALQFERIDNSEQQFKKAYYVDVAAAEKAQNVLSFHQTLLANNKSSLPKPVMIPIINGDITIIFPYYPVEKRIGDAFVQSRLIRSQIFNQLQRTVLPRYHDSEVNQINDLYNRAYDFALSSGVKYGDMVTRAQVQTFARDFIWPELRTINGEPVLVPVVHLTDKTIAEDSVNGHQVFFSGGAVQFKNIHVGSGTLFTRRNTYLQTAGNFTVAEGASVVASGDLNLLVGGTLQNLSGHLSAQDNVNIIANQYLQKTLVHRYATRYEQGTRLGEIASVNATNGDISIRSHHDIVVQGGRLSGNNIIFNARGNIQLISQDTTYVRNQRVGGFDENESIITHTASKLSAQDNIYLMASGAIELNAATLSADKGAIQILAGQGVYIGNAFNQFQSSRSGTVGKVTTQEREFQTIAIRSALDAGKNVLIATKMGDVILKATAITSAAGTDIYADNGKVNLLLAKEQDHYYLNRVTKGFWRIKTETIDDQEEFAVYNEVVGGVNIHATRGLSVELGQKDDQSLDEILSGFEESPSLAWMADVYADNEFNGQVDIIYQELVNIHKHDKTSTLSPAAMAIIAIAMAVAMGPAGFGAIGGTVGTTTVTAGVTTTVAGTGITGLVGSVTMGAVLEAGALTLATQTVSSLANGDNLGESLKALTSKDSLKSLATSMATAGALDYLQINQFEFFDSSMMPEDLASLSNQVVQIAAQSTVSTGISTLVNGGNSKEFLASLQTSMMTSAVNRIGAKIANKIGSLASEHQFNEAMRYVSHAALGCSLGLVTDKIQSSDISSAGACTSAATGAVVGELTATIYTEQMLSEQQNELLDAMKELGLAYDFDISKANSTQASELQAVFDRVKYAPTENDLAQIRVITRSSVDMARLSAGLLAFASGLDVNMAADAGGNAAENNNAVVIIQAFITAAAFYTSLYKVGELAKTLDNAMKQYKQLSEEEKKDALVEAIIGIAKDAAIDVALILGVNKISKASKVLPIEELQEKLYLMVKSHPKGARILAELGDDFDDNLLSHVSGKNKLLVQARLNAKGEALAKYYQYKKINPNTVITETDIAAQLANGKMITANGRFAKLDGKRRNPPNIPDDVDYRINLKGSKTISGNAKLDASFLQSKVTDPIKGDKITVAQLEQRRKDLINEKKTLTELYQTPGLKKNDAIDIRLNEMTAKMRKYSETAGLARAEHYLTQKYVKVEPLTFNYLDKRTSHQYDGIYQVTDGSGKTSLIKLESKGGVAPSSNYKTAQVSVSRDNVVLSAQQGSKAYDDNIWRFMQDKHKQYIGRDDYKNGTMDKVQRDKVDSLGDTLGKIDEVDAVKYIGIEQKFDPLGNLSTAAVKFFD